MANAVDGQTLILVTGGGLHHTFDSKGIALRIGSQMSFSQVDGGIIDGPIDDIIQLGITLNTGDLNLVLQCKVALVDNTQCGKLIAAARAPKEFGRRLYCLWS